MNFDQYQSEEKVLREKALLQAIKGQEEECISLFIQKGPEELRKKLKISRENDWTMVFDHLVFKKGLLKRCVMQFMPFFKGLLSEKGPLALRKILGVEASLYDSIYEEILDLVGIAEGALYDYVYGNSYAFIDQIKKGEGKSLRAQLCLQKPKYDRTWGDVLSFLSDSFEDQVVSEAMFERGMTAFNAIMNNVRVQRSLRTYKN